MCTCVWWITCDALQQSTHVEDALPHDALDTDGKDGGEGHGAEKQDSHRQKNGCRLPESTRDLIECQRVRATHDSAHKHTPPKKPQCGAVDLTGCLRGRIGHAWEPHKPISTKESDELAEGCGNTEKHPEHGAASHNDMTHDDVRGGVFGGP